MVDKTIKILCAQQFINRTQFYFPSMHLNQIWYANDGEAVNERSPFSLIPIYLLQASHKDAQDDSSWNPEGLAGLYIEFNPICKVQNSKNWTNVSAANKTQASYSLHGDHPYLLAFRLC